MNTKKQLQKKNFMKAKQRKIFYQNVCSWRNQLQKFISLNDAWLIISREKERKTTKRKKCLGFLNVLYNKHMCDVFTAAYIILWNEL